MTFKAALFGCLIATAVSGLLSPAMAQTPAKPADGEETKIEGMEVARQDGGFLGVKVEGLRLELRFYDSDKKPVMPDAARAAARWKPVNKSGEERTVLNPSGDGMLLVSTPVVRPPFVFKVYLTLIDEKTDRTESLVIDLRDLDKPAE